jgi:endonuclease/exonuclease/phosphatase family metal-dependent hydrolase
MVTLCSFNANNLFVRYRFGTNFPGAPAAAPTPPDPVNTPTTSSPKSGFLPKYEPGSFQIFNADQRTLAATAIARGGEHPLPDLLVLQEIESMIALRAFNERHLESHYTQALVVDSRDYRQIDVGLLAASTVQVEDIRSHVDELAKPGEVYKPEWPWQFSRDCLEVVARLPGGRRLSVYVNHFKSKFVQPRSGQTAADKEAERQLAATYRLRQARAVVEIVQARHRGNRFNRDWFVVAGDFNSLSAEAPAQVMTAAGLEDVLARLPSEQRWTEYYQGGGSVGQLDYLFLSPSLNTATAGTLPYIERRGIGMRDTSKVDGLPLPRTAKLHISDDQPPTSTIDFRFPRFTEASPTVKASDHCPVFFDLP